MRVVVGPVAVESARAWLSFARTIVAELEDEAPERCFATPEVLEIFRRYIETFGHIAARNEPFRWEADLADEVAEYHAHAFNQVANHLAEQAERSGVTRSPEEGAAFYDALVQGVITSLALGSASSVEFADHLEAFWPGRSIMT